MNVVDAGQESIDGLANIRIEVDGVDDFDVGKFFRRREQCLADFFKSVTEAFAAMAGDQDDSLPFTQEGELLVKLLLQGGAVFNSRHDVQQGVDHCVARDVNALSGDPFPEQILTGGVCRGKVQGCQSAGQLAVGFFWPGRIEIARAQTGLDMSDRDLLVVGRQGSGERGSSVAMHEDDVGLELGEDRFHALQNSGGDVRQVLARLHDVQIEVRRDLEKIQYLVQHLAMLAGYTYLGFEAFVRREA
ncbi:hypothetical protein D3C84_712040 [compost metagenome]